jgi:hypothetical protein
MILFCKSTEVIDTSGVGDIGDVVNLKNATTDIVDSDVFVEKPKKNYLSVFERFFDNEIGWLVFSNKCDSLFHTHSYLLDIGGVYLHYCVSRMAATKSNTICNITINNEDMEIFKLYELNGKLMLGGFDVGRRRVGNLNVYFIRWAIEDMFVLVPVNILIRFMLDHNYICNNKKDEVRELFKDFHKKLYSFYTTGQWKYDDKIIVTDKELNNEFMKYNEVSLMCKPFDHNLFINENKIISVDSFNFPSTIIQNDGLNFQNKNPIFAVHSVTPCLGLKPNHFATGVSYLSNNCKELIVMFFNNLGSYEYIVNSSVGRLGKNLVECDRVQSDFSYIDCYKKVFASMWEFKDIESISIKHVFPYINSSCGYSNSCWFVPNIVDLAHQLTILTEDNLLLNTNIEEIMKNNMFIAARLMLRHLVRLVYGNLYGNMDAFADMTIDEALNSKLVKDIQNGDYKRYFTLSMNKDLKTYDFSENFLKLNEISMKDLRFKESILEKDLAKLIVTLKVLTIGYYVPYCFTLDGGNIDIYNDKGKFTNYRGSFDSLFDLDFAKKINDSNRSQFAFDVIGDMPRIIASNMSNSVNIDGKDDDVVPNANYDSMKDDAARHNKTHDFRIDYNDLNHNKANDSIVDVVNIILIIFTSFFVVVILYMIFDITYNQLSSSEAA